MNSISKTCIAVLAFLSSALVAAADEASWDFSANVELQSRFFTQDARWSGQNDQAGQFAVATTAEVRWRSGNQRAAFMPYLRWDEADGDRSLIDLREAYWAWETDSFELLVGANTVFWGVTESVHLVDIINQTDAVADIDGEDKLGQPLLNLALQRDWGLVSLYVMPYFRARTFAGTDGRFRTPLTVATDRPQFESSAGRNHIDLALRYSHYIGDVDIGLSLYSGTSREPRLLPDENGSALLPYYDQIDQLGVDLQYTRDAWLWKLEAIVRNGFAETFAAAVGGFEYTFYQVGDSNADFGLLLEYQYDARSKPEPVTIADNDVFVGARLALNDTQDTALLAGVGYDVDTGETFVTIEAERRLGEDYVLELRTRVFTAAGPQQPTYTLARDDYVQLQVSRYF
ncbi:MAG: hypothetical protein OEO82_06740 [Gammaproteobacteria bacterium]|nr:hypothetical protein [Gammaproteobacteria bacterium]